LTPGLSGLTLGAPSGQIMAKSIVITGVTRGIGRSITEEFHRLGHKVIGCGRTPEQLVELEIQLEGLHDFSVVDVASEDAVRAWAERIIPEHGPPDLLINNAGVINRNADLIEVPSIEFDIVIDVNIKGTANIIRHFVPAMIEKESGVIVNFSSGWGRSVAAKVAPYCASKWAIEGISKSLAMELPEGMACVPLSPGAVNTEMLQSCFGESANDCIKPDDFAKVAAPFILDLGPQHNGESLSVTT